MTKLGVLPFCCLMFSSVGVMGQEFRIENQVWVGNPPGQGGSAYCGWNHAGDRVYLVTWQGHLWIIDPLTPESAVQLTDPNLHNTTQGVVAFSPNDEYALIATLENDTDIAGKRTVSRIHLATGAVEHYVLTPSVLGLDNDTHGFWDPAIVLADDGTAWLTVSVIDYTQLPDYYSYVYRVQVDENATVIPNTAVLLVDNFALFQRPVLSPDLSRLILDRPATPTTRELYLIRNATEVTSAWSDWDIRAISDGTRYATGARFSQDGTLIFYCENTGGPYGDENASSYIGAADFDIMVVNTQDVIDFPHTTVRIAAEGNQARLWSSEGGTRFAFIDTREGYRGINIATFALSSPLALDGSGRTIAEFSMTDGAGTELSIGAGTLVMLEGIPQVLQEVEISMRTPISVLEEIQQPPVGNLVRRKLGTEGLEFSPPVLLTLRYTNQEVAGLDESMLQVLHVSPEGEIEEAVVISRDLENNTLIIALSHFSEVVLAPGSSYAVPHDYDYVYVDFDSYGAQLGTPQNPYISLSQGTAGVNAGGTVIIRAGFSSEALTVSKAMTLSASPGIVRIGDL